MQYFPRERSSAIHLYGWMSDQKEQQQQQQKSMRTVYVLCCENSSGFDRRSCDQQRALLAAK
jgi:hypothetical protein